MTRQTLKNFVLVLGLLGAALIPSTSSAQDGLASKLPGKSPATAAAQTASHQAKTRGAPSYAYTLFGFPGALYTSAIGINLGATGSKTEIVGGYSLLPGPISVGETSFIAHVSGTKTVKETYEAVNDPHVPPQQQANSVNDSGHIVGYYVDSSGVEHGYELSGGKFTALNVPFAGATGTIAFGINNSDEIVGCWGDSNGNGHGFTLIGGTYTSLDYPGASYTCAFGVNSNGDVVGQTDNSGFLLSGGTYTSFNFPGAVETFADGINDSGDVVGVYCPTSECIVGFDGAQGYLLSGGVFTTIAIPGEFYTEALGINNDGAIVGFYQDAAGLMVSFLATP